MKATVCLSSEGRELSEILLRDTHGRFLPFTKRRIFFYWFTVAIREVRLQYLGYQLSWIKSFYLALRSQVTLFGYNPKLAFGELVSMHRLTFEINSQSDFPIHFESVNSDRIPWVSRTATISGVKGRCFGPEIEWDRLRKSKGFSAFIWSLEIAGSEKEFTGGSAIDVRGRSLCRSELSLFENIYEGKLNLRTLHSCEIYNGLFAVENQNVSYTDRSNFFDDRAWPTNFIFPLGDSLALLDSSDCKPTQLDKAIMFGGSTSWFHFLVEVFPRFLLIDKENYADFDIIFRGHMPASIIEIIESLDVKSIVTTHDGEKLVAQELLTLTDLRYPDSVELRSRKTDLQLVRDYLLDRFPQKTGPRLIYLERDLNLFRRLRQREKLRDLLVGLDFEVVKPDLLTASDQVKLFSKAQIVVAESGAALTSILFMNEGANVIELHPGNDSAGLWGSLGAIFGVTVKVVYGKPDRIRNFLSGLGYYKIDLRCVVSLIHEIEFDKPD